MFPFQRHQLLYYLHDYGFANWVASNPHDAGDGVLAPPHTFREVCDEVESRTYPFTDVIARHSSFWGTWGSSDDDAAAVRRARGNRERELTHGGVR